MYSISKEFLKMIFQLFDAKIGLKDFEAWIYENDILEKEIDNDYLYKRR